MIPLATILMIGGTASSMGGSMYGAWAAEKSGKMQQEVARYAANYQEAVRQLSEERIKKNVAQTLSAQRAGTAAQGFSMGGTPSEIQVDTEMQGELDVMLLRSAGGIEQMRTLVAGRMARAEGYGMAAGLSQRAFGTGLNTGLSMSGRSGWFSNSTSSIDKPLLSSGYGVQR